MFILFSQALDNNGHFLTVLIILFVMTIAIILQVTRRDPLARLTEALLERKVEKAFLSRLKLIGGQPSFDNGKIFTAHFVPFHPLIQAAHDGKDGGSLKLICDGNQQVEFDEEMKQKCKQTPSTENCEIR